MGSGVCASSCSCSTGCSSSSSSSCSCVSSSNTDGLFTTTLPDETGSAEELGGGENFFESGADLGGTEGAGPTKVLPQEADLELSSKEADRLELSSKRGRSRSRGSSKGSRSRAGSVRSECASEGGRFWWFSHYYIKRLAHCAGFKKFGDNFESGGGFTD